MIDYLCLRGPSIENDGRYVKYFDTSNLVKHPQFTGKKTPDTYMPTLLLYDSSEIVQHSHIC